MLIPAGDGMFGDSQSFAPISQEEAEAILERQIEAVKLRKLERKEKKNAPNT